MGIYLTCRALSIPATNNPRGGKSPTGALSSIVFEMDSEVGDRSELFIIPLSPDISPHKELLLFKSD